MNLESIPSAAGILDVWLSRFDVVFAQFLEKTAAISAFPHRELWISTHRAQSFTMHCEKGIEPLSLEINFIEHVIQSLRQRVGGPFHFSLPILLILRGLLKFREFPFDHLGFF